MTTEQPPAALTGRLLASRVAAILAIVLLAQILVGLAPGPTASPASAQTTKPTTAVMMGDDFFSGEAGRWRGNSLWNYDNRRGTDLAIRYDYWSWTFDPLLMYSADSWSNGCHRSLSAPVTSMFTGSTEAAYAGLKKRINIACSGAQSKHVWGYAAGGTAFKGEQPQTAQLYNIAGTHDVKLIMLGIGGNDLGFNDVYEKCRKAYGHSRLAASNEPWIGLHCSDDIRAGYETRLDTVRANVMKSVDLIRATMAQRGYEAADYRLVVVGYPGILSQHNQYQFGEDDRWTQQCPFRTTDTEYLNETLTRKLNAHLHAATHLKGTEFLDITQAFNGHRLCEGGTFRPWSRGEAPVSATAEWVRFADSSFGSPVTKGWQGHPNESLRPNEYGQKAIGRCMRLMWSQPVGQFGCLGSANTTPADMRLVDGKPLQMVSNLVQKVPANLGQVPLTRSFTLSGNPYSPADKAIVEVEIDAPFHHVLEIRVQTPDGSVQSVLPIAGSTGGGKRTHRALVNVPTNPNGAWHVRIWNDGQYSSQDATVNRIAITQY